MPRSRRWLFAILGAYALGFLLFPPRTLLVVDETAYVQQAMAFAHGKLTLPAFGHLYPPTEQRVAGEYPPGTAALQTPLVWLAGWRGAAGASVIALIAATLLTAAWLEQNNRNALFALFVPGCLPSLFFGRVAMSDLPSAAIIALTLWLLWRADDKRWWWSFVAGLAAGLSLLFRETNVVLLAPLVLGAILRRKCVSWALVAGGIAGIAVRAVVSHAMFGSAAFVRESGYGFSWYDGWNNAPWYALILLVLFPLAAVLPFLYRGPRRMEIVAAFGALVAAYLFYGWDFIRENGPAKGLLLASRYHIPALPLIALMAADVVPRWMDRLPYALRARLPVLRAALLSALAFAAFGIHAAVRRLEAEPRAVISAIQRHTTSGSPVITNHLATLKYFSPVYGARRTVMRAAITPDNVPDFVRRYGRLHVVFLDRADSRMFTADAAANETFLHAMQGRCTVAPVYDQFQGSAGRLRILTVDACP